MTAISAIASTGFVLLAASGLLQSCGGGGSDGGGNGAGGGFASVSGSIPTPIGTLVDGDVNDPNEDYTPNDTLAQAQAVPRSTLITGYVNEPGTGAPGRSFEDGDSSDFYSLDLSAGDVVSLRIGQSNPIANDLDLRLYSDSGTLLDASIGSSSVESLSIPSDGQFIIEVLSFRGASNYFLHCGSGGGVAYGAGTLSTQTPFVRGEAIVTLDAERAALPSQVELSHLMAELDASLVAGDSPRELLISFDQGSFLTEHPELFDQASLAGSRRGLAEDLATLMRIKSLRGSSGIDTAEPNFVRRAATTSSAAGNTAPDDPAYPLQWHYEQINLPAAWNVTTGSPDVVVAVIDTGVLLAHPDLAGQLTNTGYDFVSGIASANDGDGIDPNPNDPGDSVGGGNSWHGTHCAGTVGARTNNGTGGAGVSWGSKIMPLRGLGRGGGTTYDILQAVRYAVGLPNDSGISLPLADRADVISLSLGGPGFSQTAADVYAEARNRGAIVIAAAGNDDTSQRFYPAAYSTVVSVSAVDITGSKAFYSNFGSTIDIAAPGGATGDLNGDGFEDSVLSTSGGNGSFGEAFTYRFQFGTSMATPHVAGVAALMKSVDAGLGPAEFDSLLSSGSLTSDIGAPGRDDLYGHGLLDAQKAVAAAGSGAGTFLTTSPSSVFFDPASSTTSVSVSRVGKDGSLTVGSLNASKPWILVQPSSIDEDGLGSYSVEVDRSALSDGTHTGEIAFEGSDLSRVVVQVSVQVSGNPSSDDGGFHYVLLIDAATLEVVGQDEVAGNRSGYPFSFEGVPTGRSYYVVAGTDRDNDNFIDNNGETLGAFPTLDQLEPVQVTGPITGLTFPTAPNMTLPGLASRRHGSEGPQGQFMRLH